VKLCDFGLARYKERFVKDNHGKIGTPHWMAPEILRGERYEEPADVYSFGVIVWEMLTNRIPYVGRSIAHITGIVGYHREKLTVPRDRQSSATRKHSIYAKLRKIVNNCLIFQPEMRPSFQNIVEYIESIEMLQPEAELPNQIVNKLSDFLDFC
jgi:serine/threonine protein kinase